MIKAIAIDDEPVALDIIKHHAEKLPFLELEAVFFSATEALGFLKEHTLDVLFLDISMPGLSGLELAEMVRNQAQIIFTTAHAEHALKGFELAATDYLLKPINFNRFLQACQLTESRKQAGTNHSSRSERIFIKDGHSWIAVDLDELLYVRGEDNYVSFYTTGKRVIVRMTMTEVQQRLPAEMFVRVHRSFIVSLGKIDKIGKGQVVVGDVRVPLSLVTAGELLEKMGGRLGG